MKKKRILWCGEASYLSTGYSTISLELLRRFHATGKYELCELASYGDPTDDRSREMPWHFVPVMPDPRNQQEQQQYLSNPANEFGSLKFEETCLAFRPDVVCDVRDPWMVEHQERSCFRPFYRWAWMPTVDARPQLEQWVATMLNADAIFTYSDWALDLLRQQGVAGRCSAPAGADLETFQVKTDRATHRKAMGVDPDSLLVGMVARNQRRKLYPDLIRAFAHFLTIAPAEMARRAFLYLHTSWPDVGWDIPMLIREAGIGHKVVMTYFCKACGACFPSFFMDCRNVCRGCGSPSATFPNSHIGVSRKILAEIYSLFDVYVQYANSEGQGMPLVEAAACGIPVMAVDYSAMSDVVRKLGGTPIPVQRYYREPETHCFRALPDNQAFAGQLVEMLSLPGPVRAQMGWKARQAAEKHYNWDTTASRWMEWFDEVQLRPDVATWGSPSRIHRAVQDVPPNLSNSDLVRWGMCHVAGRPELANSYLALRMIRDLNWGMTMSVNDNWCINEASMTGLRQKSFPFGPEEAMNVMYQLGEEKNHWERRRAATVKGAA